MNHRITTPLAALAAGALLLFGASQALAAGTVAGQTVNNNASITFSISGVQPPPVTTVTPASFTVDHKIKVIVANAGGTGTGVDVIPNGASHAIKFTVTNDSNTSGGAATEFQLTTVADGGDNFDMNNIRIYQDNGNGTWDGTGTETSLGATAYVSLAVDAIGTYFIVADTPPNGGGSEPSTGETAVHHLVATAWDGGAGGSALTDDKSGDNTNQTAGAADDVFADDAGTVNGVSGNTDIAYDGKHSDRGTYTVNYTKPAVTKASAVKAGGTGYYIPGETIVYTISIDNSGGTVDLQSVVVEDAPLPGDVKFVCGSIAGGGAGDDLQNGSGWSASCSGTSDDTITGVRIDAGTVSAGASKNVSFEVILK